MPTAAHRQLPILSTASANKLLPPFSTAWPSTTPLEIVVLVFATFTQYRGAYFYSLIIGSVGIVPYAIGNIVHFDGTDNLTWSVRSSKQWCVSMANMIARFSMRVFGWWLMVVGQSVVLWSRLNLIVSGKQGHRILRWTMWMIILVAIGLLVPTTVLAYGLNAGLSGFKQGYPV
jgi:hypothetical protein